MKNRLFEKLRALPEWCRQATSINGTFVGTNLDKPGAWSIKSTAAKVFKSSGSVVIIR